MIEQSGILSRDIQDSTRSSSQSRLPNSGEEQGLRQSTRPNALRCFACGEPGHRQTACPNQSRRILLTDTSHQVSDPIYDSSPEEETSGFDIIEEHTCGDIGPMLVVRRICLAPPKTEDEGLRSEIFRTTCKINKKICSLVIDYSSCQNVISEEAAQKLSLQRENHPSPYKFSWVQEKNEISVSQRCRVTLSIGTYYKDKIYCDIIPMDVSHILLDRPWLFDRDVTNNGRANTYSFNFGNRRIVLLPDPPLYISRTSGQTNITNDT